MAILTLQATTNQTPDPALGSDNALTTPTNTSYASSTVIDTGVGAAQNKSIRWSAFPAALGQITKVVVKFNWNITSGGADADNSSGGSAAADASFISLLSVDGGATFPTTLLTRSVSVSGIDSASLIESGSVSFNVTPLPTINQIAIRNRMHANATQSGAGIASASVTATVTSVQLEVTTLNSQTMVML